MVSVLQSSANRPMAASLNPPLVVSNLKKVFDKENGAVSEVIADISISLGHGEIVSVVGPSGCGSGRRSIFFAG